MQNLSKVAEVTVKYKPNKISIVNVSSADKAVEILLPFFNPDTIALKEQCLLLLMNQASDAIGVFRLSEGGITGTIVDIKIILSVVLKAAASSIIICHNHPSGRLSASDSDIQATIKLRDACGMVDVKLLDHLIVSPSGSYYSIIKEHLSFRH